MPRISIVGFLMFALAAQSVPAAAQISDGTVKIGVLNDQSGIYADFSGRGSVVAAELAVEDFGGTLNGKKIEVLSADHQNKADLASAIAREWIESKGVDAIVDLTTSAVALAVQQITNQHDKALLISSASNTDLTGKCCSPNTVHWGYDSYGISSVAATAGEEPGGSWFFITGDWTGGHAQEAQARLFVERAGGKVIGSIRHPANAPDFSSYLLKAIDSKALFIGLANAGADSINALKQGAEFNISRRGQRVVPLLLFITDVHALGLPAAQRIKLATTFYWDRTDETRAWSKRYMARMNGNAPTMAQAGAYTLVLHYLKSVAAAQSNSGKAAVAQMKKTPVTDALWKDVVIREDGRSLNDIYLVEVKTLNESKYPWDYYTILKTVPGEQAFRPLADGNCPMVQAKAK